MAAETAKKVVVMTKKAVQLMILHTAALMFIHWGVYSAYREKQGHNNLPALLKLIIPLLFLTFGKVLATTEDWYTSPTSSEYHSL